LIYIHVSNTVYHKYFVTLDVRSAILVADNICLYNRKTIYEKAK